MIIGKCHSMCPEDERILRQREELVHPLEKVKCNGKYVPNPAIMVKEYSRSAAGRNQMGPMDLRPGPVLMETVEYLLGSVAVTDDMAWCDIYDFIFDRLRAVRQDMTIQQIGGQDAEQILEKIVNFHIYAGYRLCEEPVGRYDPQINDYHTQECLKNLLTVYKNCEGCHRNRAEFESLYMIFNLGQTDALMHFYELPDKLRRNSLMKRTYSICIAYCLGNYIRALRMLKSNVFQQRPLFYCAFHRHLTALQSISLRNMCHGYHSKALRYPLQKLTDLLWFDSEQNCLSFCEKCGVHSQQNDFVIFNKSSFHYPDKVKLSHVSGIDSLLCNHSLSTLLLQSDANLTTKIQELNIQQGAKESLQTSQQCTHVHSKEKYQNLKREHLFEAKKETTVKNFSGSRRVFDEDLNSDKVLKESDILQQRGGCESWEDELFTAEEMKPF